MPDFNLNLRVNCHSGCQWQTGSGTGESFTVLVVLVVAEVVLLALTASNILTCRLLVAWRNVNKEVHGLELQHHLKRIRVIP